LWAVCTPPGQNWWPKKWRKIFTCVWWNWGGVLSSSSLCGGRGGVVQLQSGENNNIFYHLGEIGSELKITAFSEKSGEPKRSIAAPRLCLWVKAAVTTHISVPPQSTSENLLTKTPTHSPNYPLPPKEEPGLKHPEWNPQTVREGGRGTTECHTAQNINLKERQGHRESPCQKGYHLE
jgi:hypothetical protein